MVVADVEAIISDVPGCTAYRYGSRDSVGNSMDTVKIIDDPAGGYLGIYHTGDEVKLAVSADVLTWTFVRTLDGAATQPTIRALSTGGFLTAVEYNDQAGSGGRLRLRHYPHRSALWAGEFDRERTVLRTLSACNEGTPHIEAVRFGGNPEDSDRSGYGIDHSQIELGFHYQRKCDVDRQAVGTLQNFSDWHSETASNLDAVLTKAAGDAGRRVRGNIGGRDSFTVHGVRYTMYEVQHRKNDFGSWRVYLQTGRDGPVTALPITTHGGTTAFANPTVSVITTPPGRPALVVTLFVPFEGAAPGEAGELVFYRELPEWGDDLRP